MSYLLNIKLFSEILLQSKINFLNNYFIKITSVILCFTATEKITAEELEFKTYFAILLYQHSCTSFILHITYKDFEN